MHEGVDAGDAHGGFEGGQEDLAEFARPDVGRRRVHATFRYPVTGEMLGGGHHPLVASPLCRPLDGATPIAPTR